MRKRFSIHELRLNDKVARCVNKAPSVVEFDGGAPFGKLLCVIKLWLNHNHTA